MSINTKPLAVVTGASSGIGYELAVTCAKNGFDLLVAADEAAIHTAADEFRSHGAEVEAVEADLSTLDGVDQLLAAIGGRTVDALLANAGRGLGHAFLDQDLDAIRKVIDTNVTGTIALIHKVGRDMVAKGSGRILIAGYTPGAYQAVYNATKAFIDSFAMALREEIKDSGVTVTCLEPGPVETRFFETAGMLDTGVGQSKKEDPAVTAKNGFDAMMSGDAEIISGWKNKVQVALSHVTPDKTLAKMHAKISAPGTGTND